MKSKAWIRIAIIFISIHLLGHLIGHLQWDDVTNPTFGAVVKTMKGHQASFMGATRTMADYYHGYSLIMFVFFGFSIAILSMLFAAPSTHARLVKGILLIMAISYAGLALIEWFYFFPFAAIISFLVGLMLFLARRKTPIR